MLGKPSLNTGSIKASSLEDKIKIAHEAGYLAVGIFERDFHDYLDKGGDLHKIAALLDELNLSLAESAIRDLKKDRDVLEKTGLRIGAVMMAREVYSLVMKHIPTVKGICTFERQEPPFWRDCSTASRGFYENAISKGLWT